MGTLSTPPEQVLPEYASGAYMYDPARHGEDALFKAHQFLEAFRRIHRVRQWSVESFADVGCGSGKAISSVLEGLAGLGVNVQQSFGYDVYPGVESKTDARTRFVCGDFADADVEVDLVTLFDVFEHVPNPLRFLQKVGARCKYIGLHIPLENNWNCGLRNKFASRIHQPGHLIYLDAAEAITLLSMAGLRVVHFHYTPGFMAPSGGQSALAKVLRLPRRVAFVMNPWLLSKTLGGCSLMVLVETAHGWSHHNP